MPRHQKTTQNLSIVNEHPSFIKGPGLLHELVAPSSTTIAIDFLEDGSKRRKFSFKTLHTLSDALAQNITRSIAKLENASAIVPVLLPQCPELYIVILAILKAGKAFCPLSLDTPAERLSFILSDISADLLITDSAHGKTLKLASNITTLHVDHGIFRGEGYEISTPSCVSTNDLAYVLYTSGSTGLPKAVSVSHRAVTQSLLAHDRHIPHFTRFLQFAASTFDVSIFEIFFPWYRGRTLTSRTRARMLDNLSESIRILDVDAAELTPTVVSNLLEGRSSVPGLKLLLTIGEMLTRDVIEEYGHSNTKAGILWAMYGPTETAIHCTLQPRLSTSASTKMIGFPLDTVSAFVVSPLSEGESPSAFSILPIGEEGELAIGGPQVAEEYLNRPELTATSFMHHPDYGYLYRTGDRAKLRPDGTLECLGRVVTGQVKLRGQRIELGEIEQIIMKVESCRATTVLIIEEVLVAFCATGSRQASRADVLKTCKRWLPGIMIPSEVIFMNHMPQLPSGKIDRNSLVTTFRQTLQRDVSKPKALDDVTDDTVLGILQRSLQQDLGQGSSLASARLDSLQAIRLASRVRSQGYLLTALDVLSASTVDDLLQIMKSTKPTNNIRQHVKPSSVGDAQQDIPELEKWHTKIACTLPCTPQQEAMLAETITRPKAYCNWVEIELTLLHTIQEIQTALQQLAQGNEILRSGFYPTMMKDGTFVQVVWKELDSSCIQQVDEFSRLYSLGSYESLLRPLSIQAKAHNGKSRLLLQIHHALYDGWSLDLILQDLGDLLHGRNAIQRQQFREVIQFYNDHTPASRSADEAYWAEFLRDRPELLLPNFNGKTIENAATRSFAGRSAVKLQSLHERSREITVNPQVYFQAATAFVFSLYFGSNDVIIGNVTSGRTISVTGIEDIIGPCIASLPFRLRFNALARVRDILHSTQQSNRESLKHYALPLRDIAKVANVHVGRRLFDVLFVWQQSLNSASDSSTCASIVQSADELEFKITLEFEPRSDHVSCRATFDSSTVPEDQIKYLFQQIDAVVQVFLEETDCMTADITAFFPTNVISIANPTPRQRPIQYGPSHAVEKWASTTPNKTALVFFHRVDGVMQVKDTATYTALNGRANQLARVLSNQGVRQGHLVGVIMEKSIDLYVAILAVLKLGAGYLPLVPDLPSERIRTILSDAQVTVCINDATTSAHLTQLTTSTILSVNDIDFSAYPDHNINTSYNGAHVAYAVFTSGSTGTPKGVLVTQENLMSNLDYLSTVYPYSTNSRLLQSCSQAFDVSVFEIFFSWHVGICLCTARKDDLFTDLEGAINQLGITHLSLTPTVAALIDPDNVPRVEFLVTAGEAVTEYVRRRWAGRGLYQGYGPSETTNICTVRSSVSPTDMINNIGRPFDNTSAFVLDPKSSRILPRGAVGELSFGGYQVFQGYLNQPDLTADRVIEHPTYGRIYRSGDLGTLLSDDSILFVGRIDDQVKIRGQRVELSEISSAVLDQECVKDCATLLLQNPQNSQRLVNFWVPARAPDASFRVMDILDIRSNIFTIFTSLAQRLPTYMIPSHLVPVTRLPMTAQGKIDKRLLKQCFENLTEKDMDYAAHSYDANDQITIMTGWELRVAEILAKTLNISLENIRRASSFFNLGLDSVSAISFSNGLRKAHLGDFAISTILKNSTIAQLAVLQETHGRAHRDEMGPIVSVDQAILPDELSRIRELFGARGISFSKILPCTPLQEAMLSSGHSTSETAYSNVMVFSIQGDLMRLQECWALMVHRHEILRTSFVATDDPSYAFVQVVNEDTSIQWGNIAWSDKVHQYANGVIATLLHADKPPVWFAIASAEQSTRLLFCCHHAVYDGTAIQTLLKELQEVYHRRELPPPISYDVYLQNMLSQNLSEADKFWTKSFQEFKPTSFPNLTEQAHNEPRFSASKHRRLNLPLSEVREACQSASVSILSVVQATWAKLLHFYTGESDICFGNVVSGRALPGHGLERLVAPCFNTLPVRINFDFRDENLALAKQVHALNVDLLAFQLTPLRRIQNIALKDGGRLFDTLVILQQPSEMLDINIWTLEEDRGDMDLPLVCEISQNATEDKLDLSLHYHSSVLSGKEAEVVVRTFDAILATIINRPHASASDTIGIPSDLWAETNSKFDVLDGDSPFLHDGFERNAQANPDRVALDFLHTDNTRTVWSFVALNNKANAIAHALIDAGVEPEDIIPIHISKSPLFYASILGVLKAGAAFAPVHPDLPKARRRLMLEDLKAKLILYTKGSQQLDVVDNVRLLDVATLGHLSRDNPMIKDLTRSKLAYCIFTSGSTGVPKAVSMEHRAPMHTIESSRSLVPWNNSSRLLQYAATTFDMCYYDCFLAWTFGFTLCAADQNLMMNELERTINTLKVDLLDLTPSVAASLARREVPDVKWLYCIGEAMLPKIVREWKGACVNSYGPTEAAFCTTIFPVSMDVKTSVIGKPFPSTSFAVFPTKGDRPLPILSIGELYIGGAQLARGYCGKSELTEKKFVTKCGQRFYRSGDIVRMLSDGNFEFIGRADDQVKIRGLRVELGEINSTLEDSHPGIATAVTQVQKKDAAAKEQLVSFLVANRPMDNSEREEVRRQLRQTARDRLPLYMVPQFLLFVDQIPRSMAGKIDKNALADIFRQSADMEVISNGTSKQNEEHHWTELESRVRDILARLSSTSPDDVSPTTTIYQLGLDSISAVQIAAALRKHGHNINAMDVIKYLTCVDLAAYLERGAANQQPAAVRFDFKEFDTIHRPHVLASCNISNKDIVAIRPCTPLQRGMISQMLANEGATYVNYIRLKLEPGMNLDRVKQAWNKTMVTHQMLRTGFVHLKDKDHPFGMVEYSPDAITLPWVALSSSDELESVEIWLANLQRKATSDTHQPLWDIRAVHGIDTTYLDLAIFHALFDAQSLQMIYHDIITTYNGQSVKCPTSIDTVIDAILERSNDQNKQSNNFWSRMGEHATPCRFPNLAPLRYAPELPVVCTRRSTRSLFDIENACRTADTTVQAVGLAGWLSLISAYTGEPVVTCGIVLSGRSFEAAESAVFPCINTVPFAHAISTDPNKTMKMITAQLAEVHQHQHIPLNDIQKIMGYPNEAIFDTIFAYQKLPTNEGGSSLWSVVEEKATIEYPVSIELEPKDDYLEYRLTTMPHVIPREQAALMLEQLDHLMQCFIFPAMRIETFDKSLYSITPAKESTLLSGARLLHEFVELTALEHPRRISFEFAKSIHQGHYSPQRWTYSELDEEGNRVANLLISIGVKPGNLVGVCFDKCPEASFAMLGILKAGCAFVAIDPRAPATRQSFIVQDSGATAVLSMAAQSASFKENINVPVVNLDETTTSSFPDTKPSLKRAISSLDRSYCLYTSGTTGTPKGCELTHENAVQALLSFQRLFAGHWDPDSRWLQFASFHFDVSVLEQFWSWSVGICVVSAPRDVIFEDLANSISTLGITHIDLTPSLAQILHPDDVPSLCKGVFITGGESLKQEILDVWGPKGVIYNGYGPTEATIGCTMYPRVPANGKPSNIGRQFDNVGSLVLQPSSDIPVLRGGVGELCVSGKLVGKGYLNRDDLTKKSFPYLARFKERVYRTGDLVRILHDETFEFLGRADDQVKLRGQRLEIGEINSVVRQSDNSISDVATLVLKHPRQQKEQLVAFVVQDRTNDQPKILLGNARKLTKAREACHERLPPYMVPTHFVPLTNIPLNVNNKADSKKLKGMYEGLSVADLQKLSSNSDETEQSWSSQEIKLRTVVKHELDVGEDAVGRDTSLFELGMDSISVIGVARAMKQAGFSGATASLIMKHSSLRRLAKAMSAGREPTTNLASLLAAQQAISAMQHRHRREVARALSIRATDIKFIAPCTPLQQGMIARSLESEDHLYFNTFQFELSGLVDKDRLKRAWETTHMSTEILRTVLINTEDGYIQAVLRYSALPWVADRMMENESKDESIARSRRTWLASNQHDFARPFEVVHFSAPGKQLLILHIFHGLYDGISIDLIFKAVWDAYNRHEPSNDAPSFHSALAHGPLRSVEGAKTFWQQHILSNVSKPLLLLTDKSSSTESVKIVREVHTGTGLEPMRRKLNVTAQAVAQACWLSVLQERFKTTTTVGIVVSGRSIDLEGADRVVGPMFNTIPYQHQPQQKESWASIVKRVHDFNVAAHPYQHTPLRDIIKWCKTDKSQPLFDSLFVYQVAQAESVWTKNEVWTVLDGDAAVDYPLALEIDQRPNDAWNLTLVTQGHISDEITSNELLDRFEEVLHRAIMDPTSTLETKIGIKHGVENVEEQVIPIEVNGFTAFQWTDEATTLREALADLTNSESKEINESTSILELGLDSIDAIKLSSKLKKRGIELPVSGIMRGLTIARMLPNIKKIGNTREDDDPTDKVLAVRKRELNNHFERRRLNMSQLEDVLPLTPLQEAMVAEMVTSEFTRYYNFDVMELKQETNIEGLQDAWTQVVKVSPILRTSFLEIDDPTVDASFAQMIHTHPHDFCKQRSMDDKPNFPSLVEELRKEAVELSSSKPPFRILLVTTPGQTYLVLCIAHALYDGWSLSLLHADVKRAYEGRLTSRPTYQHTLSAILSTSGADAATFWGDFLFEAKSHKFIRRPDVITNTPRAVHRFAHRSKLFMSKITNFAKKSSVSLQTLGQSVFAIVLASYVQALDVTFGSVLSGRDDETTSQLLFPTMNTVAIRTILHGTRLELLRHVQDNFTNIQQWQHFPLRKALALSGAHGGLFESLFIYQKSIDASDNDDQPQQLYTSIEGHSDVEYPICVEMEVIHGELTWRCAVKNEVFDEAGAKELLSRLDKVVSEIVEWPDQHVIDYTTQGISVCGLPPFQNDGNKDLGSDDTLPNLQKDVIQPSSETMHAIREVLAAVSGTCIDDIADDMTIFHIGLDSISAIKVSSLLRRRDIILSVGEMLKASTVDQMAHIADVHSAQRSENENYDYAAIVREALQDLDYDDIVRRANIEGCSIKDINEVQLLPATAGQLYMLSMWLNTNGSNFYPEFTFKLTGKISFEMLQGAWKDFLGTNPILRTYFVATQHKHISYVQLVRKEEGKDQSITDITGHTEEQVTQAVKKIEMSQPWAKLYVSQTDVGWDLRLKLHHALYDGVSLPILMQQLQDICDATTPPVLGSNNTFASFIASCSNGSVLEARKSFWTAYMDGIEQRRLLQPGPSKASKAEIFKSHLLPTKLLEHVAQENGVSIQALFIAAYAKLYARLTTTPKRQDVVLGVYLANRSLHITDIESAAIPTVNLLPLRVHTPIRQSMTHSARQIQKDLQRIGELSNTSASLFEINQWTGVKIDTFVNFLSLPDAEEIREGQREKGVEIIQTSHWDEEVNRITHLEASFQPSNKTQIENLSNEEVNRAYLHAIDVEATIRNGALDVGIFAPEEMLSLAEGNKLLENLRDELEEADW